MPEPIKCECGNSSFWIFPTNGYRCSKCLSEIKVEHTGSGDLLTRILRYNAQMREYNKDWEVYDASWAR